MDGMEIARIIATVLTPCFGEDIAQERANNAASPLGFWEEGDPSLEDTIFYTISQVRKPHVGGLDIGDASLRRLARKCVKALKEAGWP